MDHHIGIPRSWRGDDGLVHSLLFDFNTEEPNAIYTTCTWDYLDPTREVLGDEAITCLQCLRMMFRGAHVQHV